MSGIGQGSACEFDDFGSGSVAREFWGFVQRIRNSGLPAHVRHTALEIWLHMRPGKMWSNPSVARLARHTGLSERTIQSDLKKLNEAGILEVEFSKGGRAQSHKFIAKRIEKTAQELLGIIGQNPEPAAGFKDETQNDVHRFDDQKPRMRRTVKRKTPQPTTENPAGRAPEAREEVREESSLRSDSAPSPSAGAISDDGVNRDDPEWKVWHEVVPWIVERSGKDEKTVRKLVGKWTKTAIPIEFLPIARSAAKKRVAGDALIAYIASAVAAIGKVNHQKCHRENGRIQVFNGFRQELETLLAGRDLARTLDRINGNIPQSTAGPDLEAKIRSEVIKLMDIEADWARRNSGKPAGRRTQEEVDSDYLTRLARKHLGEEAHAAG